MAQRTCEWCGNPLPADARFCPRCGNPVEAWPGQEPAEAAADVAERKLVTILFADLSRSTELATMLDPERYRELLSGFYAMVSRELASLRGRAEKFAGDAVMAVFGLPHAHEDDALRAVRAGLMIRDRTAKLGESLGLHKPLGVRVGINSGPVAASVLHGSAGPVDRPLISGAPVNMAARLQQAAEPGEILAGETTVALARYTVEFGEPRTVAAKGFAEEVRGWPVLALSTRSTRRTIPLVGRERELRLLQDTFDRVRESSRAHLVTLVGEPGIGKSRLVDELVAGLPEDTRILTGRTGEFEEDVAFAPIAEMLRREMGLERDASPEHLRGRLQEVVEECCDPTEAERVAARLGLALGLGLDRRERREPQRFRSAEVRAGLVGFLEGLTRRGPAVLVFEDMQAAQPSLLDLVEEFLKEARNLPVLVIVVARDGFLEERQGWGSGIADALTIRLEPLAPEEGAELAMAAAETVDDRAARQIASVTGGNPFFIVETTGMLVQEHPGHDEDAPHSHLLPPTVQAVVASRIDHLPEGARDLVRKASVFSGASFHLSELGLIAEARDDVLRTLEEAEILLPDREHPRIWGFRHEMLREVAYESLPKRERERLHLLVADGISARSGKRRQAQAVAFHLEQAARSALDLRPADRSLADRAVEALTEAGDVARWRIESGAAIDLYERALALAEPEERWGEREGRILSRMGESRYWLGEFEAAAAVLERALEVGPDDTWTLTHASRFLGDIELNIRGRPDRAEELFKRALEAARELADPYAEARTLIMAAWVPYWRGDLDGAREMFEEALAIARANPEGDPWGEARALTSLPSVISGVGDELEAAALAEQALALGRDMNDPFTVAVAEQYLGSSLRRMWRLDEALQYLDHAVRTFRDLGARWELASALSDRGNIHRLRGDRERAEQDLRETIRISRRLRERSLITWTVDRLVRTLVEAGDLTEARRTLAEAVTVLDPEDTSARESILASEVMIAIAAGELDTANSKAGEMVALARAGGGVNDTAALTWSLGRLLGPEVVGGEHEVERARRVLEEHHWIQSIKEPELLLAALGSREAAPSA